MSLLYWSDFWGSLQSKFKEKAAKLQAEYSGKKFLQERGERMVSDDKATNAFVERKIKKFYRMGE